MYIFFNSGTVQGIAGRAQDMEGRAHSTLRNMPSRNTEPYNDLFGSGLAVALAVTIHWPHVFVRNGFKMEEEIYYLKSNKIVNITPAFEYVINLLLAFECPKNVIFFKELKQTTF